MKQKDFLFIKDALKKSIFANDYLSIVKVGKDADKETFSKIKVMYNDKLITFTEIGYAYLISWWCDGSITGGQADELTKICYHYNERF